MTSTDLTLKDIYAGANDITIVARVLGVYPISEYKRKDGTVGRYRKLSLFDKSNVARLTIWDDNQDAIKLEGITVDAPVRVSNGYVRPGLDGKPSLNLGKRGKIELLSDYTIVSRLTSLSKLVRKIGEVEEELNMPAVEGTVSSASRFSSFTRSDGSPGSLTQFELTEGTGKNKIRVVVWNPVSIEAKVGQMVLVTNLRVRKSINGDRELHGDSATVILDTGAPPAGGGVKKAELIIGDDTGEITLVGWRNLADRLVKIEVGEKLKVLDVVRQVSKMGMMTLEFGNDSKIEKVSD